MPRQAARRLSLRLALASLGWAAALAVVCGVGLVSLRNVSKVGRQAVGQQLALLNDARAFEAVLYQKGFVAEYMLTHDRAWLEQLEKSRTEVRAWLARAHEHEAAATPEQQLVLRRIEAEYNAYDSARSRVIELFDAGDQDEAQARLVLAHAHVEKLVSLVQEFGELARADAERRLGSAQTSTVSLARLIVGTSVIGALASLAVGFLLARKITKPIYELQLRVESAAQKTRIQVDPRADDLDGLAEHVGALVQKLEDQDASLVEHRRRLVQSEKLSAVGELAAKMAHEILNPLAGMKAATQLLARSADAGPAARETADALGREVARVEELVRRLVDYSRPLAPRVEVCAVGRLLDLALEAAAPQLAKAKVLREEAPDLPPLEVDPLLMTQALTNLLTNAAQAMPDGGTIFVRVTRADIGRPSLRIEIEDEGPGIPMENLERLFHPFFTTKPKGHGLGLAVSQNIALEHGGRIAARNRDGGHGAVFDVTIPLVR